MQLQNPDVWEMFLLLRNAYGEGKQRRRDAGAFLKKIFFGGLQLHQPKKRSAEKSGGNVSNDPQVNRDQLYSGRVVSGADRG